MTANKTANKRIACVITTFFTNSHADVIVGKFLRGFPTDDGVVCERANAIERHIPQQPAHQQR